ncbi:growth arrest and DNA damage-inducible proteins-interacting protein 1 [Myiozetetes cayanensis]|uniref:growth arrest and DNA damage-inducible proteins-interacting protein 1 n=1 Tax=Myiozetetes cayanensis TaxID=478635 RepID=UPI00215EE200|nr:growth arrest and DNA damage-inducible proteins-interacting protein 1 [Myiozetetes cayanensis]
MAAPLARSLRSGFPPRFPSRFPSRFPPLSPLPAPLAFPARPFVALPLRRRPGPAPPADPEEPRAAARRFGRLGSASGVAPERLWPSPERLRELRDEEREWDPPLRDVEALLDQRDREEQRRREERAALIARCLAEMPARVAQWRQQREQARERARVEAARRQRLLAEAGLGEPPRAGTPGRGSARAQELLEELERQRRRDEKRRRRQERVEAAQSALAAAEAAAKDRAPPGTP